MPEQDLARMLLEHRDSLFAYTMAMVRDWTVAEELFQDVSLVILQKAKEDLEVQNFRAWSREIARRTILDYWKTKGRRRLLLSGDALESLEEAFATHDEDPGERDPELLKRLKSCLDQLPRHLRRIVDLRYRKGLSLIDIGRNLGRSAGAAQVALSRIRMRLLDCVKRMRPQQT